MKKLLPILLVILLVFASLTACTQEASNDKEADPTEVVNPTEEPTPEATAEPTAEPTTTPVPYPTEFNQNDTLVFPGLFEITMTTFEFAQRVDPSNPGDFHTYYEVKENDKTYVHTIFEVKNLQGDRLSSDEILSVKVIYDGKYEYTGFDTIEDDDGEDFTYTSITSIKPLTAKKLHYLNEVPLEVKDSGKDVAIEIKVEGKTYTYTGEEGTGEKVIVADEVAVQENKKWESYTQLNENEMIAIEDYGEVTLTLVDMTQKVEPSNPKGYYTYYQNKSEEAIYLHAVINFKNTMTISADAEGLIDVDAIHNNKYSYSSFNAIEEDGGHDFGYSSLTNIDPLTDVNVHYIIEVPIEVKDAETPLIITFKVKDQDFYFKVR